VPAVGGRTLSQCEKGSAVTLAIRSNISSLTVQRNLAVANAARDLTTQRTSSGQRINSAKDDAAGLAIAGRLTSKVRGYTQAARNVNEAISFTLTAGAGLQSAATTLQRIRQLTVQAGNAAISKSDRTNLAAEVTSLIADIQGVTDTARFNNKKLLDGSGGTVNFMLGSKASDALGISISSIAPTDIGQRTLESNRDQGATTISSAIAGAGTNTFAGNGMAAQQLTISGGSATTPIGGASLLFAANATAKQVAAGINDVSGQTGVTAKATTTATLSNFTTVGSVQFTLFGKNTGAVAITANVHDTSNLTSLANAINFKSGQTGITAVADRAGNLVLTEAEGNDIGIKNQGGVGEGLNSVLFRGADVVLPNGSVVAGAAISFADASGANTIQTGGRVSLSSNSDYSITTTAAGTLFKSATIGSSFTALTQIDLSSAATTAEALKTVDAAILSISKNIGEVGSLQNRLDKVVDQLQTQTGAADAARSRISDSDYASETSRMTRARILQQAATTVMTQANAQARNVMTLLKF
jgi:flagellin